MPFGGWWGLRSVPLGGGALSGSVPLGVVWVEIGALGWVVRADVVGGKGEHGGGSRGGGLEVCAFVGEQ